MTAIMLLGALSFTACGDDDDEDVNIDEIVEKIENGTIKAKVTIAGDNPLVLTAVWPGFATEVHTATFNSDASLKSYIVTATYANDKLALMAWNDLQEDEEDLRNYKRDGRVITHDSTADILEDIHSEATPVDATDKQMIVMVFNQIKQEYETGNYDY